MITVPGYIERLQTYKAGKPIDELAREKGLTRIVKLASNENPLGPSPKGIEAAERTLRENHRYVDPKAPKLTAAISDRIGMKPSQIICGAGTDALLGYAVACFSRHGDEVLTSEGTFIGIYVNTLKQGRALRQIPMRDYRFDLDTLANAINDKTRIVYIANPNNPTGTIVTHDELVAFLIRVPSHVLVILDEAYFTFAAEHEDYPDGLKFQRDNLLITRTFSKDFGLAGLRLGYAVGPENLIDRLYRIRLPFEPSLPAQEAGIAALDDSDFITQSLDQNKRSLKQLADTLSDLGITYLDTRANFLLALLPTEELAAEFSGACLNEGLILRHVKSFGFPEGVRISSGTDSETEFAVSVMRKVWDGFKKKYNSHLTSITG